ncbi:HlyD family efflux transporter periplasmic adaptor subunit [Phenylobacterium sp.]|uniref:efflux RND transporter periplasmic adaptor subunit n=1 Tax=Phenylobacterium sp. TaxID=1871053 RepID=UPI0025F1390B|nr:HlyD family efflux transporter periplasmic adaptor subunit [Phenylobacterium sp.]
MKRLVLPILLALAACTPKPAPPAAPKTPQAVAVAKGVVEAPGGLLRILAPRDGLISALLAEEGAQVAAGQVLAQLDDRQSRLMLAAAAAELGERQAQVGVATTHADGTAREARRLASLAAADAATRSDAEQAQTTAAVARGEQRQALQGMHSAEARQRLAAFDVEAHTVRAPIAGRLVRRTAARGAYVSAAAPLFVLEPNGARLVRAELDEAFADQVTPKTHAVVTREYQQGKSYPATVVRVSDMLAGPSLAEDASGRADTRVVSVLLSLPPNVDLRLGQRVLVRFTP